MFKRNVLSTAIVLAGSVWGSAALANTESGAKFSSAAEINKVSEWMGKEVQDNEGNDVGEISDFALNAKDGSIAYAVVEMGGMFSNKAIAVPLTALSTSAENDDELTLQVSQSEWQSAETFSGSDWPLEASLAAGTGAAVTSMPDNESASETADSGWQQSDDQYEQDSASSTGETADSGWQQSDDQYDEGSASGSTSTGQTADSGWQQSDDQEGQYDQGSGAVSSFDRDVEFDTLDTDGDGYLSTQEYEAAKGSTATGETDADQDGRISRSEFAAFEAREQDSSKQDSKKQEKSSSYDRSEKSDRKHSYDSDDSGDLETDD